MENDIDNTTTMAKRNHANKKYLPRKFMDNFFGNLEEEFVEWFGGMA